MEEPEAVVDVARNRGLDDEWLNNGPTAQLQPPFGLPTGFLDRATVRRYGALTLRFADRLDQIYLKLYAAVDRWSGTGRPEKHRTDLATLRPTHDELLAAAVWVRGHEADPTGIDATLQALLATFGVEYVPGA